MVHTSVFNFSRVSTYLLAALFVLANVVLPQLFHLIPLGGLSFQPMFLLVLVAALVCGWQVALLTALVSPLVNTLLFDMPTLTMLPVLLIKGGVMAFLLRWALQSSVRLGFRLAGAVVATQLIGVFLGWGVLGQSASLLQDFYTILPAMLLQLALVALKVKKIF
jgi:hypothetical protein